MQAIEYTLLSIWNALVQTLYHEPWVFLILAYCIFIGVKASKSGTVPYIKMLVVPAIFTYLSVEMLITTFHIDLFILGIYLIGLFSGGVGGWIQGHKQEVKADRKKLLLQLKGTWSTLIIVLIIFVTKFYFGYTSAVNPSLLSNTTYVVSMLLVSGITTGLFVGRAVYYSKCLFFGVSVDLSGKAAE